jgi:hypothetical protein
VGVSEKDICIELAPGYLLTEYVVARGVSQLSKQSSRMYFTMGKSMRELGGSR